MKEILFRGEICEPVDYAKAVGTWVYGFFEDDLIQEVLEIPTTPYDLIKTKLKTNYYIYDGKTRYICYKNSIGQFTGLEDKNGQKILEGDILQLYYIDPAGRLTNELSEDDVGVVVFDHGSFILKMRQCREVALRDCIEKEFSHYESNVGEIYKFKNNIVLGVIIGNIYDNPELIKE